jgi:hypothetical protein
MAGKRSVARRLLRCNEVQSFLEPRESHLDQCGLIRRFFILAINPIRFGSHVAAPYTSGISRDTNRRATLSKSRQDRFVEPQTSTMSA